MFRPITMSQSTRISISAKTSLAESKIRRLFDDENNDSDPDLIMGQSIMSAVTKEKNKADKEIENDTRKRWYIIGFNNPYK